MRTCEHCHTLNRDEAKEDLVVDYLASMTDDYFVDLYSYLFPDSDTTVCYKGYFE